MYDLLKMIMVEDLQLDAGGVHPDASREDAGLDSLAVVDLCTLLNERHGIPIADNELFELATLAEIAQLMEQRARQPLTPPGAEAATGPWPDSGLLAL